MKVRGGSIQHVLVAALAGILVGGGVIYAWNALNPPDFSYYTSAFEYSEPEAGSVQWTMKSEILGEDRIINIAVPPSYETFSEKTYPVLYMPDGGKAEDFNHVVYSVGQMIETGRLPEMFVVGIENTKRQRDLTGPTEVESDREVAEEIGQAENFRRFLAEELKPRVEKEFRCNGTTAIIGESLAGYFVVETALRQPDLFQYYIALSPSLWWNDNQLAKEAGEMAVKVPADRRLFLASANETDIYPQTQQLANALKAANVSFAWDYQPRMDLTHQTIFRAMKKTGLAFAFQQETENLKARPESSAETE